MGERVVSGVGWSTPANTWRYTPVTSCICKSLLLYFVLQVYKYNCNHVEIHTGNISPLVFCEIQLTNTNTKRWKIRVS